MTYTLYVRISEIGAAAEARHYDQGKGAGIKGRHFSI